MIDQSIFREYDIRGTVPEQINETSLKIIANAIAAKCMMENVNELVLGRDGRLSGENLLVCLSKELQKLGINIVNVGLVTSPLLYFAAKQLDSKSGVMITGSHNPKNYNGFKTVINDAPISGTEILSFASYELPKVTQLGKEIIKTDLLGEYVNEVVSQAEKKSKKMKVVVDCGNGAAGEIAPMLMRALGHEVIELFCEVDGTFPNHHPDPAHLENLQDLIRNLASTDNELGLAFDGDADRLGVVTKDGQVIFPDRQMMLFAKDVLTRHPNGQIIYDVKCTRNLAPWIEQHGGQALMWKTGHSLVKAKLKETGAPLAGEMSGHIFFKDRWFGFDDGLYTGARLLEILSKVANPSEVLNALPNAICTPELQLPCAEGEAFILLDKIKANPQFPSSQSINTIDGVRVEYADGFGLARPSNTTPIVVLRFEADSDEAIQRIQGEFKKALLAVKPDAKLPF